MRPAGKASQLEARRRKALGLLDEGLSLAEVARRMECSASSVMRWRDARAEGGEQALKVKKSPGRPKRLTPAQRRELFQILRKGPRAAGYPGGRWTALRVAEVIEDRFGVSYHRDHIGRLIAGLEKGIEQTKKAAARGGPLRRKPGGR